MIYDDIKVLPQSFEVVRVIDLAGKFGGVKTFVESAKEEVPLFYKDVGEHLRAWVPPPPKLKREVASEADKGSTIVQKEAEQSLGEVEQTDVTVAKEAIDEEIAPRRDDVRSEKSILPGTLESTSENLAR